MLAMASTSLASTSLAQGHRVSASTHVYTDDDSLTVVHPSVAASVALGEDTSASVGYEADIITAATVDVRTSASVRPFEETRHGGSLAVRHALHRTLALGAGAVASVSPDYRSYTGSARLEVETSDRMHAFSLDVRGAHSEVGRVHDSQPVGELLALGLSGSWTAVLSRRAVLDIGGAFDWNHGYLENPYRFVRIAGSADQLVAVPEEVPDDRFRGALSARLRLAATERLFVRARYRLHADDWGVFGHTVEARVIVAATPDFSATLGIRFFVQNGASFYHGVYRTHPNVPTFRTRDRELASGFGGKLLGALRWRFLERQRADLSVALRAELHQHRYIDTPLLRRRRALVTGLSLIGEL